MFLVTVHFRLFGEFALEPLEGGGSGGLCEVFPIKNNSTIRRSVIVALSYRLRTTTHPQGTHKPTAKPKRPTRPSSKCSKPDSTKPRDYEPTSSREGSRAYRTTVRTPTRETPSLWPLGARQ